MAASSLEDEAATIFLVNQAVDTGKADSTDLAGARAHIVQLANAGNPMAMVLQAQLLSLSQIKAAVQLCERAAAAERDFYLGAESLAEVKRKAWGVLALLKKQAGDRKGARLALEKGALEHDDPWAYYTLATSYKDTSDPGYLQFLLKAAASGIPQAAHKVGRFYLELAPAVAARLSSSTLLQWLRALLPGSKQDPKELRSLAAEWFSVSVESPIHERINESRVYLALLLRGRGKPEEGRALLKQASGSTVFGPNAISWFLDRWDKEHDFLSSEFLTVGINKVIEGKKR